MRIVRLEAENFMRIVGVDITPQGDIVTLTGKNGAGKTSIINSIWAALGGGEAAPEVPIRKGQEKAVISLDLGDLTIMRKWTEKGTTLKVSTKDGMTPQKPQQMLDKLIGALAFDPLAFSRMEPKKQLEELRRIAKVDPALDLIKMQHDNEVDFNARQALNRDAKAKRAQAEAIRVPADVPPNKINEQALLDEMQRAAEHNAGVERVRQSVVTLRENVAKMEAALAALDPALENTVGALKREAAQNVLRAENRITALEHEITVLRTEIDATKARAEREIAQHRENTANARSSTEIALAESRASLEAAQQAPEPIDIAQVRQQLEQAKQINAQIDRREARVNLEAEAKHLEGQANDLTLAMADRDAAKRKALSEAVMPVAGLGLTDQYVTFNDVPFSQASMAEQIRVGVAIAAAVNPKLRVICIRDGSLIDDDGMAIIRALARQYDMQVWIECVRTDDKAAILIEDGRVVDKEQAALPLENA